MTKTHTFSARQQGKTQTLDEFVELTVLTAVKAKMRELAEAKWMELMPETAEDVDELVAYLQQWKESQSSTTGVLQEPRP